MDVKNLIDNESMSTIQEVIRELVKENNNNSFMHLKDFLLIKSSDTYYKFYIPELICIALLQKGKKGVEVLKNTLKESSGSVYPTTILESLWDASHGKCSPEKFLFGIKLCDELKKPLTKETIIAAKEAFHDIVVESREDEDLFEFLTNFIFTGSHFRNCGNKEDFDTFRDAVFEIFSEATISLSSSIINEFDNLIHESKNEETYQKFLFEHPVLLDPIAEVIIPKQKLGIEFVTDFVIRRLDNIYTLIEIEKSQDKLFTENDDFTAKFTHAVGQILDFQAWIDEHSEYARSLLSGISSPKGLLVIGRSSHLTDRQIKKLHRFCTNLQSIEISTYDDIVINAKNFYKNIIRNK